MKAIGWLGAQLLAWCGLPAVIQVLNQGHADGYSLGFILMWFFGEVLTFVYVLKQYNDKALLTNYSINIVFISIILYHMV